MKHFLVIVALAAAVVALLSSIGDSTPSAAADAPLLRQPIVAEVELSPVTDTIVARADYTAGSTLAVPPPRLEGAQPVVVALLVEERGSIIEGALIASVGGRPLIALDGPIPMYRTILPSDTGPDVELIQLGLARLGYLPSDHEADGVFGASTMAAVEKMYRAAGFVPLQGFSRDGRRRGPTVPLGEIAFIPGLPATVATVSARPGETATESVVSVANAAPGLSIETTPDIASILQIGQPIDLSDSRTGFEGSSVVSGVGSVDDGLVRVQLEVPVGLGVDDVGRNFMAVIRLNDATPVLNVPLGAILTDSDGSTYVHVLDSEREFYRRPVRVERTDLGRAVIAPGALESGELVIVGWYEPGAP